jgi:1,4-alpha-glucan branching enzyme
VAVFGRDAASSRQVWNAHVGYPGDPVYREFYRDIGFDLEHDYIAPYVHESGLRLATGIKYHRVTGRDVGLGEKAPWEPGVALERAAHHGDDFVGKLRDQALAARARLGSGAPPPLVVAPYDAELFGHWWHEGPAFLDRVMRRLAGDPDGVRPTTPSAYLAACPPSHRMQPAFSSWGEGGYAGPWLNHATQWIYPMVHAAGDRAMALARRHAGTDDPLLRRALNQMARELFLAQASDWAFMIHMGTNGDYPRRRVTGHVEAAERLARQVQAGSEAGDGSGAIDAEALTTLEECDNLFPTLRFETLANSPKIGLKTH